MALPEFALAKLEFEKIRNVLSGYLSTPAGELLLEELHPSGDRGEVVRRLDEANGMMHLLSSSEAPPLQTLHDVSGALAKARVERFVLDGRSLAHIGMWAVSARLLRSFFSRHQETVPELWRIAGGLIPDKELESRITKVVDEKGEIQPNASPELSRIGRRLASQRQAARTILQRILKQSREAGMTSEEEATLRSGRLVIPVRVEHKRKIKGLIHDTSATGQTVYMEPVEVFEKNNEVRELESAWNREVERLLRELTAAVGEKAGILTRNATRIGRLDLIHACARLGMRWEGTIPEISGDGSLVLKECRNPLLLLKHSKLADGKRLVVPLDLDMAPEEQGIIITGPNAGGKSVTLKTFGLAVILAQCGIPLPAQEGARLPVLRGLYVDMGDEQSIDQDLSTFSSRLTWMKQVLHSAEPGSWILMDEAGSGTDPDEGTALVQSFLEILSEKGVRSIVTTHHGALKVFAHETAGWSNASMEFDQQTLSPTYRFQKGIPGSSYAFEIAERLELPGELTRHAREWVGSSKNRMESLIISLEQESQRLQREKSEIRRQQRDWKALKDELDKRLSRIREERDSIRSKAMEEADGLLRDANRKIEEAIRAAAERDKEKLREKRREIEQLDQQVRQTQQRKKKRKRKSAAEAADAEAGPDANLPPKTGDAVRLIDSNMTGELVEISGKQVTVDVNGLRIKTGYDNLIRSGRKPEKRPEPGFRVTTSGGDRGTAKPFRGRLDVRGKRGPDAVQEVMHFVDEGVSRGIRQLTIVHGKGDGILRKLVHEHLASRGDVPHFETAPVEEGGDGCTYVYF